MSLSTSLDDLLGPEQGVQQSQKTQITYQQPQVNTAQQPIMDNNQFVDAILTELEGMPDYGKDTNAASQQYAMNHVAHIPPPQLGDTSSLLKGVDTQLGSVVDLSDKYSGNSKGKGSFLRRYKKEFISTAMFLVLMFIMSLHQVNRLLFSFMPKLILENGQISIIGILLKTVIATIIFGLVVFLT